MSETITFTVAFIKFFLSLSITEVEVQVLLSSLYSANIYPQSLKKTISIIITLIILFLHQKTKFILCNIYYHYYK